MSTHTCITPLCSRSKNKIKVQRLSTSIFVSQYTDKRQPSRMARLCPLQTISCASSLTCTTLRTRRAPIVIRGTGRLCISATRAVCDTTPAHINLIQSFNDFFLCKTGQALCAGCRDNTHRAKMFSSHEIIHLSKFNKDGKKKVCAHHRGKLYNLYKICSFFPVRDTQRAFHHVLQRAKVDVVCSLLQGHSDRGSFALRRHRHCLYSRVQEIRARRYGKCRVLIKRLNFNAILYNVERVRTARLSPRGNGHV
jgi:hypothetical protein